jgi:hypothetical protein
MELSPETLKTIGAKRLSKATGLGVRTLYRWAAEGIPGEGTVRKVRELVISEALQKVDPQSDAKPAPKGRKRAA